MAKVKHLSKYSIIRKLRTIEGVIKKNCYDCMGGQKRVDCELETCSLFSFRPWAKKDKRTNFEKDK